MIPKELMDQEAYRALLRRANDHEVANLKEIASLKKDGVEWGWTWSDVSGQPARLNKLVAEGVLRVVYKSNKKTLYRLVDREDVSASLAAYELNEIFDSKDQGSSPSGTNTAVAELPEDWLDIIFGYDDVKDLVTHTVTNEGQVHLLFIGPPATAKSLFLQEIERLPGVAFVTGSNVSKAGISQILFDQQPALLIIDEIDKLAKDSLTDLSVLLSLMEDGRVTEHKHQRHREIQLTTKVFAAGNTDRGVPPELLSRFMRFQFPKYTKNDFIHICTNYLEIREGMDNNIAKEIATSVWNNFDGDIRQARHIARLCGNKKKMVGQIIDTLLKYR